MSWSRIKGVMIQEAYITRRESAVWFDLLVFSTMSVAVFGLLSQYLARNSDPAAAINVILGMLLWEVLRINQYCISVNSMWNMWSRNLGNIFISPVTLTEYIVANCGLALIKTVGVFTVIAIMSVVVFDFNIMSMGVGLLLLMFVILSVFAWAMGWLLLGLVFRYGTSIQAVTWGFIMFLQPITAVFFPLDALPSAVRALAYAFPATYVFEAARDAVQTDTTNWSFLVLAIVLDIVWGVVAVVGFSALFRRSRVTGQFARNDS